MPVGTKGLPSDWKKKPELAFSATFGTSELPLPNFLGKEKPLFNTASRARLLQVATDNGVAYSTIKNDISGPILDKVQSIGLRYDSFDHFESTIIEKLGASESIKNFIRGIEHIKDFITL